MINGLGSESSQIDIGEREKERKKKKKSGQ
jgi:hypothetical protein